LRQREKGKVKDKRYKGLRSIKGIKSLKGAGCPACEDKYEIKGTGSSKQALTMGLTGQNPEIFA